MVFTQAAQIWSIICQWLAVVVGQCPDSGQPLADDGGSGGEPDTKDAAVQLTPSRGNRGCPEAVEAVIVTPCFKTAKTRNLRLSAEIVPRGNMDVNGCPCPNGRDGLWTNWTSS